MAQLLALFALLALVAGQRDLQGTLNEAEQRRKNGDTAGAIDLYRSALEDAEPGTRDQAKTLVALSTLEGELGRYDDAVKHARGAAAILQPLGDVGGASVARNLEGKAMLYAGKYGDAETALRAALDLSTAAKDDEARAEQLGNLANVQFFLGRYAQAAQYYDEALAITGEHALDPWVPRRRRVLLANQATLYQRLGRDRDALAVYKQLDTATSSLRPGEQAQLLVNLGVLYRRLGDPVKALETYDAARVLFARERHVDGELGALKNRGIVLALDLRRLDAAEATFTEALEAATRVGNQREMLHARLYRGETVLRAGEPARAIEDFAASLVLANELHTPEEEWKALYGLGRAKGRTPEAIADLTHAVATIEQIRENIRVPSLRSDFLNDKREVYDALLAGRLDQAPVSEVFNILERSHSRGWRERLNLSSSVELERIQEALPERVLLLDYWSSRTGAAVIAVTRARASVTPLVVDEQQIKALIDALAGGPSSRWQQPRDAVSTLLPDADWFEGIDHIIVVPDGATALVPFELLTVDGKPLLERAAVSYTPTAVTLLRAPPDTPRTRAPWQLQLRAFGDPSFATSRLGDTERLRSRLSGASDEVRAVAREMAGRAAVYLRQDDRKALLLAPSDAPVLHLATHAMADTNAMEQSHLVFASTAGSNGDADYLFLNEAYDLPLQNVELAVLSACDTERGQLVRGEGVQSFSRAFVAAGARTTVTTLWRVADQPTAELMKVFYHHLQQGLSRDEALRRAKLAFAQSGTALADPHFWAAFVMTGDALRPVPRAISWTTILLLASVVLALIGGAAWYRVARRRPLPRATAV